MTTIKCDHSPRVVCEFCPEKSVSPKAAEAPGGQEREITEAEIANFYKAGTKPWTTEIIDNQAVVWVLRSEAEAALTLAAATAPSERADAREKFERDLETQIIEWLRGNWGGYFVLVHRITGSTS